MARHLTPVWLAWPLRRVMEIARCIPEVAWGLILIAIIGIGPMAGAVALGLHSAGCLARLFAEALENAPRAPQDAMSGIGASPLAVAAYATLPPASGPIAVSSTFRPGWTRWLSEGVRGTGESR